MEKRETRFDRTRLNIGTYCIDKYARDEAHVREMKECGIDFLTAAPADPELLDNCAKYGIGVVATGILPGWWGGDGDNAGKMEEAIPIERVREAAAKFVDHPAIWGIDAGDEPSALDYPHYGRLIKLAEELFPGKLIYLNLYPNYASVAENSSNQVRSQLGTPTYQAYIDRYIEEVKTDYLCLDNYEFAAGTAKLYDNLRIAANACRADGRDFWMVIQVNSSKPDIWLSADMLRHQAFSCLAFGAVSLNWACWTAGWWHNEVLDKEGNKTEQYEKLKAVNAEVRRLEEPYMAHRNVRTVFLGRPDEPASASGVEITDTYADPVFTEVKPEDGGLFLAGEMMGREGDGRALFLADVSDSAFTGEGRPRTLTVDFAEGYEISYAASTDGCEVEVVGDRLRVTLPPYAAVILTAEKQA
ncbi:MAG: hypothetical protein K6G29_09135 [Clostridiales bacterium]|nr:hypothetical protein [Clostridiales bacterium]